MSTQAQVAAAVYIYIHYAVKKRRKSRRWWITKLYESRTTYSGSNLLADLSFQSVSGLYKNFTRMHPSDFEWLINLIGAKIGKRDTSFRKAIPITERLALTLRFLATGDSYTSLQYVFKISKQTISTVIPEVCSALIEGLEDYIKIPTTEEEWAAVAREFESKWHFPHCVGALDGKHVVLQSPMNSGSEYINYKGFFSIVLFALVDANYNFLFVDVGCQGRISDGGVFANSELGKRIASNSLHLPPAAPLRNRNTDIPYFFIGDEAFPLSGNLMKVYAGYHRKGTKERIFNYRLCSTRRVVENVFGIASSVFRVLRKPLLLEPQNAERVVMTVALLHNFLRKRPESATVYTPPGTFDNEEAGDVIHGRWRDDGTDMGSLLPVTRVPRRSKNAVLDVREELAEYFTREGKVTWQDEYA